MASKNISNLVIQLFEIVAQLESTYPGRKFTLDGHLVGSIGEVMALQLYCITLHPSSTKTHDAQDDDGRQVQIKMTQGNRISLSSKPNYLIVLTIDKHGTVQEVYNGLGSTIWQHCGNLQPNGQRPISLSKLKKLNAMVLDTDRIPKRAA